MELNEQAFIPLNGALQYISVRAEKKGAPLLLYLHGGPGDAALPLVLKFNRELEKHFTVVVWEQRGAGKSYYRFGAEQPTLDTFLQDLYALVSALLARFEAAKAELGVKDLALLVCPAVGAPLVTGFVNPALLLPRESVSDGVLRHELIHTRRRDLWYKLLLLLARSLHWFNPLVHWMAAAASRDLERSCDEAAVAAELAPTAMI